MKISVFISIIAGLLLCGCISAPPERRPEIAGQQVPNQNITLDFTKHYDLYCHDGQTAKVYVDCQIIGYTGEAVRSANGIISEGYGFGHWLVIQLPDGRRVFISPGCIGFVEETKNK